MFESIYKDLTTTKQRQLVEAEFFRDAAVRVDWKIEGNRIEEDDTVSIGPWAGPEAHICNIFHEMAHFVEIDEARMTVFGWGLRYRQVEILGRDYDEPVTHGGIDRECRVMAFQANVMESLGLFSQEQAGIGVRSMRYMSDFHNIPGKTEKDRLDWIARQVEDFRAVHTAELFHSEWIRRNQILKARRHGTRQSA